MSQKRASGYRKGRDDKSKKQSYKKLGISNENGWTSRMRTKYFRMIDNANKSIIHSDYTNLDNREKVFGSRDVKKRDIKAKGPNLKAQGIWSDAVFDSVQARARQLIKFVIEKDEEKRKNGEKFKEVQNLKDIRHHHTRDFILNKLENGAITPKTANKYYTDIQKFGECNQSFGIKGHKNLVKESTREKIPALSKESRIRSKDSDGRYGYRYEDCKKAIAAADDLHVKTAIQSLVYQGHRKDTFFKLTWRDFLSEHRYVAEDTNLTRDGLLKGGRSQFAETNDQKYRDNLQRLWNTGNFDLDDKIFGKNASGTGLSPYQMQNRIEKIFDEVGMEWTGFHSFRSATYEFYKEEKTPQIKSKNDLVYAILKMVNIEKTNQETGEVYKPLNPLVEKREIVYKKNGEPLKRKSKSGNEFIVTKKVLDEHGKPVLEPKYTYDKLISKRRDYLENVYIAEQLSHNRPDANIPYNNKK